MALYIVTVKHSGETHRFYANGSSAEDVHEEVTKEYPSAEIESIEEAQGGL